MVELVEMEWLSWLRVPVPQVAEHEHIYLLDRVLVPQVAKHEHIYLMDRVPVSQVAEREHIYLLDLVPVPQVAEHLPHGPQVPQEQKSSGKGEQ